MTILWLPLIVKALATALLVVSASLAAERLGPVWGAIIASLPVSSGPAYVFLAMQHTPGFVAASALTSTGANAATGLFLITYGTIATRLPAWRSLAIAITVWLIASTAVQQTAWSWPAAAGLNLAVYGIGLLLVSKSRPPEPAPTRKPTRRWFELPIRAALVAAFVSMVVAGSAALGPAATGVAAVFPVSLMSLIVIVQRRLGSQAAASVALKALAPMLGFGVMLLTFHLTIQPLGTGAALSLALAISILWSATLLLIQRRRPGSETRPPVRDTPVCGAPRALPSSRSSWRSPSPPSP